MKVDLSKFSTGEFERGAGSFKESLWLLVSLVLFQLCPVCLSPLKRAVLRWFGASVGRGVVIKPDVKITFPWKLTLGDHVWLGEECWLLNLAPITIASHVCISQRAFLCTGNHDYKSPAFDLITEPIQVEQGAWVGAGAFVGPGVSVGSHAVLTAGSVATGELEAYGIYRGNPAVWVKERSLRTEDGGRGAEDGGQKTEDGGRRVEDGGQKTEDGGRKAEDGGRKAEDGGRKAEDGGRKAEDGGRKAEDGGQKTEDGGRRVED